jgi:hypothetical protein
MKFRALRNHVLLSLSHLTGLVNVRAATRSCRFPRSKYRVFYNKMFVRLATRGEFLNVVLEFDGEDQLHR